MCVWGVEVLQAMAILEYLALNNAKGRILKNDDVSVQGQAVSQVGEKNEIEELARALAENAPK